MDKYEKINKINEWFSSGRKNYLTGSDIGCSQVQALGMLYSGNSIQVLFSSDGTSKSIYEVYDSIIDSAYSYICTHQNA